MRPALLIVNPHAGRGSWQRRLPDVVSSLASRGFDAVVRLTTDPGHATVLANRAKGAGVFEVVFVLGGDGTVREAAQGLMGGSLPLALLPAGTTNVLAMALGVPTHPLGACEVYEGRARHLEIQEMDVARCGETPFLMMISCGIDGEVLKRTAQAAKHRWGRLAVLAKVPAALSTYTFPDIEVIVDATRDRATFVAVSNIPYYGGGFPLAPRADLRDRRLDVLLFRGHGAIATLLFALDVTLACHLGREDVTAEQATEILFPGSGLMTCQIDGDAVDLALPLRVRLADQRLPLLKPVAG